MPYMEDIYTIYTNYDIVVMNYYYSQQVFQPPLRAILISEWETPWSEMWRKLGLWNIWGMDIDILGRDNIKFKHYNIWLSQNGWFKYLIFPILIKSTCFKDTFVDKNGWFYGINKCP